MMLVPKSMPVLATSASGHSRLALMPPPEQSEPAQQPSDLTPRQRRERMRRGLRYLHRKQRARTHRWPLPLLPATVRQDGGRSARQETE
jgi:hypothetical protein